MSVALREATEAFSGKGTGVSSSAPKKINDLAYAKLRSFLLTGHFHSGQKISLRSLSVELGFGLTPTRDAIRMLAAENALEVSSTGLIRVPSISKRDLDEIMLARLPLESAAASLAARRITQDQIDQLEAIEAEKLKAQSDVEIPTALRRNADFHFAIYDAAQAPLLRSLIDQLWLRMGSLLRIYAERRTDREMGAGKKLHGTLVKALARRDEAAAAAAIVEDIQYVADWLRKNAVSDAN